MRKTATCYLAFVSTLTLGITLSGCSATPEGEQSDAASSVPRAEQATEIIEESDEGEEVVAAEPTDPRACFNGTWLADNEFFLASFREFGDEPTSVTGEVHLTFAADGSVTTEYSGWRITMVVEGGESVITRNGVDEGTFTVNDDRVTIHEHNMGSVMALSAAGMEMVIPPEPVDYSEARYMCSASEASISTPDGTVLLSRVSD